MSYIINSYGSADYNGLYPSKHSEYATFEDAQAGFDVICSGIINNCPYRLEPFSGVFGYGSVGYYVTYIDKEYLTFIRSSNMIAGTGWRYVIEPIHSTER